MLPEGMITALGTMSGTSLDGVDAALVQTDGVGIAGFGATGYRPYGAAERALLHRHLGLWPGDGVGQAADLVLRAHVEAIRMLGHADLVGFHGQTLAHDPAQGRTHQCGDGQALADQLGLPVAWDFRSADVAAGGQGAPLAPFFHHALARWVGADAPVAFLNLGGVGNLTWVDPRMTLPEAPGALLACDTGPANAPVNDLMRARRGRAFDKGGQLAAAGQVDAGVIERFLAQDFFAAPAPKSLDRDAFAGLLQDVAELADADAVATLTRAMVVAVVPALALCPCVPQVLWVTGGGRHNATVMRWLQALLPCRVAAVEDAGLNGDMLEAQAFAYLAVRVARGLPLSAPATTGVPAPAVGGRMAWPERRGA